jgi:NAD(P)-dependent dehydrogenase (short-subunit alcohol dehydrogenase family)
MTSAMKTALVTGANRGIGLELCRQLAARGDKVVAVVRKGSEELDALPKDRVRIEAGVDVTAGEACDALAARLAGTHLDLVIHNAGIFLEGGLDGLDLEPIRKQFEINALGPLRLTKALLPRLGQGSKIGIVTSRMGSIGDNGSGSYYGYRMSKAAVNAAGVSLARDLAPKGIAVVLLHPGFVRTRMTGGNGDVGPDESARGLLARLDALTLATSGTFLHANGTTLPW